MEYSYPFSLDWSSQEIVDVIAFFQAVETAYEKGVKREVLLNAHRRFKEIVPAMSEEKTYCREFERDSGYGAYQVVKKAKEAPAKAIIRGEIKQKRR